MSVATARDQGLLALLAEHAGARATGVIHARRGKHKRLFCLERGDVVYALSNVIEEQFGATLGRTGVLSADAVTQATRTATERKQKLGAYLLEQGTPSAARLARAMADHVRWLAEETLGWDKADFTFEKGRPDVEGEPLARLHGAAFVVACARRDDRPARALRVGIGPPDMRPLLVARRRKLFDGAPPDPLIEHLLARCSGTDDVDALVATCDGPADAVLRGLLALRLLGMIEHRVTVTAKPTFGTPTHKECTARFDAAEGADHYGVLGLPATCARDDVREAYYYLAKRFHPDRLRTPELSSLALRVETYFAKVTEAYNTLYDPALRAAYDAQRADRSRQPERDAASEPGYLARQNYARGKTLVDKGRFQDAIQFLENAVTQDGSVAAYQLELGRALIRNPRRRGDAEVHLLGALDRDPTLVEAHVALGQLYRKTGRDADALERFREALRWDPHHAGAKSELAEMGAKETAEEGGLLGWFRK